MLATALIVLSYLIGSIAGSLLLGRLVGVDIRSRGSGNAGGTNALRTLGWRFALAVVLIDIGKGALAAWLGQQFDGREALVMGCVLAAVAGHTWPLYFGFRGGKGAATLVGGLLLLWPSSLPALLAVWLLSLISSGYVGLSTVLAALTLLPLALLTDPDHLLSRLAFAAVAAGFIVFTHRGNLHRLWRGEEYRFERARLLRRRSSP